MSNVELGYGQAVIVSGSADWNEFDMAIVFAKCPFCNNTHQSKCSLRHLMGMTSGIIVDIPFTCMERNQKLINKMAFFNNWCASQYMLVNPNQVAVDLGEEVKER